MISDPALLAQHKHGRSTACAAIVVTFFPTDANLRQIPLTSNQFAATVVVDNGSTGETQARLKHIASQDPRIILRLLPENVGLAAGWNRGVAAVREAGFGWAATLDQDTKVPGAFTEQVANAVRARQWPSNIGLFAPRHAHPKTGETSAYSPSIQKYQGYSEIAATIHSGSIISLGAHEKIGGFLEKLFVDFVDYEYSFRLAEHGFRLLQLEDVTLVHEVGEREYRKLFGLVRVPVNVHSPLRQYYLLRNRAYCVGKYGTRHWGWTFRELTHGTAVFLALALTDKRWLDCWKFGLRGVADAFRGRFGKLSP